MSHSNPPAAAPAFVNSNSPFLPMRKFKPTSATQEYPIPRDLVGAPSLYQTCLRTLIRRVNEIESVGDLTFRTIEPILLHIKFAPQLRAIEQNSPQIAGMLPELWRMFIQRDFGANPDKYVPENPKSWWMVYAKHEREFNREQGAAAAALKEQLSALHAKKEKLKPRELPQSAARLLLPSSSSSSRWGGGGGGRPWGAPPPDTWNAATGSRTKDIFKKIKREVGNEKRKLTTPTHQLNARRGGNGGGGGGGVGGVGGGLNREMVEKLRRDALVPRAEPVYPVRPGVTWAELSRTPILGARAGGGAGATATATATAKPQSYVQGGTTRQSAIPPRSSLASASRPHGVQKSSAPSTSTSTSSISISPPRARAKPKSSAFLSQLQKLSSAPPATSAPITTVDDDDLFSDGDGEGDGRAAGSQKRGNPHPHPHPHWEGGGGGGGAGGLGGVGGGLGGGLGLGGGVGKKLIPIRRPKREPSLFHVKRPVGRR